MNANRLCEIGFSPAVTVPGREITGGFCGDLLSWVMGKAKSGDCWFTIMGNLNTIAVATLAEISAVVFCHGVTLPEAASERAKLEGIAVFYTDLPVYDAASEFHDFFLRSQ